MTVILVKLVKRTPIFAYGQRSNLDAYRRAATRLGHQQRRPG